MSKKIVKCIPGVVILLFCAIMYFVFGSIFWLAIAICGVVSIVNVFREKPKNKEG